jgi:hypothetical protein
MTEDAVDGSVCAECAVGRVYSDVTGVKLVRLKMARALVVVK